MKASFLLLVAASIAFSAFVPGFAVGSTDLWNCNIQQINTEENSISERYSSTATTTTTSVDEELEIIRTAHVYTATAPDNYKEAVNILKRVHGLVVKYLELDAEDLWVSSADSCVTVIEKIVKCLRLVCERGLAVGCRAKPLSAFTVIDKEYLMALKGRLSGVNVRGQYKYHSVLFPILLGRPYGKQINRDSLHEGVIMVSMAYLAVAQSVSTALDRFVFEQSVNPIEPRVYPSDLQVENGLTLINVNHSQASPNETVATLSHLGLTLPNITDTQDYHVIDFSLIWSAGSDSERESLALCKLLDIYNLMVSFLGEPSLRSSSQIPPSMHVESILQTLTMLSQRAISGPTRSSDWSPFILNRSYFERLLFMSSNWTNWLCNDSIIMDVLLPVMAPGSCSQASPKKTFQVIIFICKVYLSIGQCIFEGMDGYHLVGIPSSHYSFTANDEMDMLSVSGSGGDDELSSMLSTKPKDSILGKRKATVEQLQGSDNNRPRKQARIDMKPLDSDGENHDQLMRRYGNLLTDEEIRSIFEDMDFIYKF